MNSIVMATANKNKIKEIQIHLENWINCLSLEDINCWEEIPEEQDSLEGNAIQKADYIKNKFGYDCFSEDTGLEIDILGGAPGVYSARYAGPDKNNEANINKVLKELSGNSNREAQFRTIIALHWNGKLELFEGKIRGKILEEPKGEGGFGYDSIFQPEGFQKSFAELGIEIKKQISHRSIAVQKMIAFVKEQKNNLMV